MDKDYTIFDFINSWDQDLALQEEKEALESHSKATPSKRVIINILSYASRTKYYSPTLKKNILLQWN